MVKIIAALPLLLLSSFLGFGEKPTRDDFKSFLKTSENSRGNYTLNSIDTNFSGDELRIYRYDDMLIDEIADNAFAGTSIKSLALSNCVTIVGENAFAGVESMKTMNFTGSEEEYQALNISYEFTAVNYYAIDEGFINYWNKEIRPDENANICEISLEKYNKVRELYSALGIEDKEVVDAFEDKAGATIKDSIKELNRHFGTPEGSKSTEEWDQTGAITLIIIIAVIGMTSITIFFLLKTKQIID